MAASITVRISSSVSIFCSIPQSIADESCDTFSFIYGSCAAAEESALSSFALAVPKEILVISRSRSCIPDISSDISLLSSGCETSSPTALCRLVILATLKRGRSSQLLIIRLPIGVRVLSRTHSSEPFFSLFLRVSTISRLRKAATSSFIKFASL